MKQILFITNLPTPYRMDFYNELGKKCKLTVLFEGRRWHSQQFNWNEENKLNFKAIYLAEFLHENKIYPQVFSYLNVKKIQQDRYRLLSYSHPIISHFVHENAWYSLYF